MSSSPQRHRSLSVQVEPAETEHGADFWVVATVVPVASTICTHLAGWAWGVSRETLHVLDLVAPAAILGALEILPIAPKRVHGDAPPRREDPFVAMGRGALVGAALAVLTEAVYDRGVPAVGRLLGRAGASGGEAGDLWWAVVIAVALSITAGRAIRWAARKYRAQ